MRKAKVRDLSSLNEARAQFDRFRELRRKGEKLPEELWKRAEEESRIHSVSFVAKLLGLDYYQLAERVRDKIQTTSAVELPAHT